jgi:hypothetical protein
VSDPRFHPQGPSGIVVARQCFGQGGPDADDDGGGGGGGDGFTLTVVHAGPGAGLVTSTPAGIDCGSNCSAVFEAGASVALTPQALGESFFSHWEGCDEDYGIEGCVVYMTSDRIVYVYFE